MDHDDHVVCYYHHPKRRGDSFQRPGLTVAVCHVAKCYIVVLWSEVCAKSFNKIGLAMSGKFLSHYTGLPDFVVKLENIGQESCKLSTI